MQIRISSNLFVCKQSKNSASAKAICNTIDLDSDLNEEAAFLRSNLACVSALTRPSRATTICGPRKTNLPIISIQLRQQQQQQQP